MKTTLKLALALTLILPMILSLLSCVQKEEDSVSYGKETTAQDVNSAIYAATEGKTLASSEKGDWAIQLGTFQLYTGPVQVKDLSAKQIYSKDADGDLFNLEILKSTYDITQSPPAVSTQQMEKCQVLKDGSQHSCQYSPLFTKDAVAETAMFSTLSNALKIEPRSGSTTYYGLSVTRAQRPPPDLVKQSANCGNVPNCTLSVTTVEFEEIVRSEQVTRYHHTMEISKDVPFLGIVLKHCVKYNHRDGNRYIPATICNSIENFQYGHQ